MLYTITYTSESVREFSAEEFRDMLDGFRAKNRRLGITGLLVYRAKSFCQILEGEEVRVMGLYEEIQRDTRHKDVFLVEQRPINERIFKDWSLMCRSVDGGEKFSLKTASPLDIEAIVQADSPGAVPEIRSA